MKTAATSATIQTPEELDDTQERIYQLQQAADDGGLDARDAAELQKLTALYHSFN